MRAALVIVMAIALLGSLLGSLVRRFGSPLGVWISFAAHTLLRLTIGVFCAVSAVVAAAKGGVWFIAMAVVLAALAVFSFAVSGLLIWAVTKEAPSTK